jgi:hypothetical protein
MNHENEWKWLHHVVIVCICFGCFSYVEMTVNSNNWLVLYHWFQWYDMFIYLYIYISFIIYHLSFIIYHLSYIIYHISHITYHISHVICHMSYIIYHISYIISPFCARFENIVLIIVGRVNTLSLKRSQETHKLQRPKSRGNSPLKMDGLCHGKSIYKCVI